MMKIKEYKGYGNYSQSVSQYSKATSIYLFDIKKTGYVNEDGKEELSYLVFEFPLAAKLKDVRDRFIEEYLTYKGYTQDKRLRILTQSNIAVSDDYLSLQEAQTKAIRYAEFIYNTGVPADDNQIIKQRTEEKIKAMFFAKHISEDINTFELSNNEALAVKDLHPEWKKDAGEINKGDRYKCDGHLWECLQTHTAQENWKPSIYTSSIWKIVEEEHEGTLQDPIPYTPPMEIFEGKYYTQGGVKYRCTRSSGIPMSHDLSALVGTYVEIV